MTTTDLTTPTDVLRIVTEATAAALAKARLLDGRMPVAGPATVAAWAEIFVRTCVTPTEAAQAVAAYYAQPQPWPIMPGDVLDLVHSARRTQAERADVQRTRAELAARRADPPPRPQRYDGIDAAELAAELAGHKLPAVPRWPNHACPWPGCEAKPGKPCTTRGTTPLSAPHPSRLDARNGDQP